MTRCAIAGCRGEVEIVYRGHDVCQKHWDQLTAEDQPADALARASGMPVATATTEEMTMGAKKHNGPKAANAKALAETKPTKKATMAKGSKAGTGEVPTQEPPTPAAEAKPEPAKEPEVQKERKPRKEQPPRVFAFRLDDAELKAIHDTSGPRNASKFIRAVAAAFAAEDEGAFKAVVKEAKEARA